MAENHEKSDQDLAKAKKSMGWRVDPDEVTEEPKEEPKPAEEPKEEPAPIEPPKEEPTIEEPKEPVVTDKEPVKKVGRPEAFIPMGKYHSEKREMESKISNAEQRAIDAEAKLAELSAIAKQDDGAGKDDDIEEFMANTGFDRKTVEEFLTLAEKRVSKGDVISNEEREAIKKATAIVKEAEMEEYFENEFKTIGEPSLKKIFPSATPEKLAQAKDYLNEVSHTAENHNSPLDFIVFKNQDVLAQIFVDKEEPKIPNVKGPESYRAGNGKTTSYTADDFKGDEADFSVLGELDQAQRSQIIKDMDSKTYSKYVAFHKDSSLSVMRNGKIVKLK